MTKFIIVKRAPESIGRDECVIAYPNFVQEVSECRYPTPNTGVLSHLYMRAIADYIGHLYDQDFPGSAKFIVNEYNGVPFKTKEDVARHVVAMFKKFYPKIFDLYLDQRIKLRPFGTKLIYFVGDHLQSGPFDRNGIESITEKDIDATLGRKDKKPMKGKKNEEVAPADGTGSDGV